MRTCTTANGVKIREEISDYSPELRRYRFRHLAVPMPIARSGGVFTVEPRDDGAEVTLETSFEALDGMDAEQVAGMIDGAFQQALVSLKRRVEKGIRWDAP